MYVSVLKFESFKQINTLINYLHNDMYTLKPVRLAFI